MAAQLKLLPQVLMGPLVRRAEQNKVCFQIVTCQAVEAEAILLGYESRCEIETFQLGTSCFLHSLIVHTEDRLPTATLLEYQIRIDGDVYQPEHLLYGEQLSFAIPDKLNQILHGSCRNPHHHSKDSLHTADQWQEQQRELGELGADLCIFSGDQIYADDVAGAMLLAIHQLIARLGLFKESKLPLTLPSDDQAQLYQRHLYLPKTPWQTRSKFSPGYWFRKDEPHFSSVKAFNHLIFFEEFIACYLLNFSHVAWQLVDFEALHYVGGNDKLRGIFDTELAAIKGFINSLPSAERLCANVPVLMMFDDHDVTDDWNLTAKWEQAIANHKVSRRIISNGVISYWLFQGIGNDAFEYSKDLIQGFKSSLVENEWQFAAFDKQVRRFSHWHYCLDTFPKVVVLDTRTHRWRNEQNFNEPSGLLDWEMLMELQDTLIDHSAVLIVSPAPVFGVKAIETIQAIFNACGEPLMVDVENWMAHEGSAKKLIEIFKRPDTPKETIILSGDVHYSFCFSVQARFGRHDNRIWQLTASGIKNEFPKPLINILDKMDSILYAKYSPLNLFTKRWQLSVSKHPSSLKEHGYLVSDSAISLVTLDKGLLEKYELLHGNGIHSHFDL
ncbi:alkaline phosphatase D family protein [Pseudoalteromonas piscicida]|uniref:Metallophosphatase n=1 Tax=Pseudoalteromonas piscicida TaxID=43662 RepID=A0A2A5JSG6_PSEO7|nr:alkaline phosphatase D family protein [Pseudoalteromonas piscicida]PCK32412.1 metallophosphatase [Pseudoalteromonas piscicida]